MAGTPRLVVIFAPCCRVSTVNVFLTCSTYPSALPSMRCDSPCLRRKPTIAILSNTACPTFHRIVLIHLTTRVATTLLYRYPPCLLNVCRT